MVVIKISKTPIRLKSIFRTRIVIDGEFGYEDLPNHLLVDIFSFLSPKNIRIAGKVCRTWRDSSTHPTLWREPLESTLKRIVTMEEYVSKFSDVSLDCMPKAESSPTKIEEFDWKNYEKFVIAQNRLNRLEFRKKRREKYLQKRQNEVNIRRTVKKFDLVTMIVVIIGLYAFFSFYCYFIGIKFFLSKIFRNSLIVFGFSGLLLCLILSVITCAYVYSLFNNYLRNYWPWKSKISFFLKGIAYSVYFGSFFLSLLLSYLKCTYLQWNYFPWYVIILPMLMFTFFSFGIAQYYHIKYLQEQYDVLSKYQMLYNVFFTVSLAITHFSYVVILSTFWIPFQFKVVYYRFSFVWYFFLPLNLVCDIQLALMLTLSKVFLGIRCTLWGAYFNYSIGILGLVFTKLLFVFYRYLGSWIFFAFLWPITSFASSTLYLVLTRYYT